jgi:hypothetical protein
MQGQQVLPEKKKKKEQKEKENIQKIIGLLWIIEKVEIHSKSKCWPFQCWML